jgi:hypothetical protein
MSDEHHAYTKLPRSQARASATSGYTAQAFAITAVVAFVGLFAAILPQAAPAPDSETATAEAPAPIERASGAIGLMLDGARFAPEAFVDKHSPAAAARAEVTVAGAQSHAKAVSLLGQAHGGFVPFGSEREYDRAAIRANMYVPPGAAGGMAKGAGMGEAITACEAADLLASNTAAQHAHYGPSVAGYGPSVAGYTTSGAGYKTSGVVVPPIGAPTFVQATFVQGSMRGPDAMVQATFRAPDAMVTTASLAASAAASSANSCAKCAAK